MQQGKERNTRSIASEGPGAHADGVEAVGTQEIQFDVGPAAFWSHREECAALGSVGRVVFDGAGERPR